MTRFGVKTNKQTNKAKKQKNKQIQIHHVTADGKGPHCIGWHMKKMLQIGGLGGFVLLMRTFESSVSWPTPVPVVITLLFTNDLSIALPSPSLRVSLLLSTHISYLHQAL